MRGYVIVMVVAMLAYGGVVQGETTVFQDATEVGDDPGFLDDGLVSQIEPQPSPKEDCNNGARWMMQIFTDDRNPARWQNPEIGPQHPMFKIDVSSLNDMVINDAELSYWLRPRKQNKNCCIPMKDLKISRLLPGKAWIEGTGNGDPALDGEPSWNSQAHYLNPAWDLGGATAATDIDMASTVTVPNIGGLYKGELREHRTNVTGLVQAWTHGVENNGMIQWGGVINKEIGEACSKHYRIFFHGIMLSEYQDETEQMRDPFGQRFYIRWYHRPALIVDWDPLVVDLDILPSDDPNLLTVNMKSNGRLPVAILGSEDYNVNNIDVNSISINDMIFPVKEARVEKDENGDGLLDLVIHFSRRDVISGLGLVPDEVPVDITVTATTVTGGPLSGTDSVIPMPTE